MRCLPGEASTTMKTVAESRSWKQRNFSAVFAWNGVYL